jgi:hypothetical protein
MLTPLEREREKWAEMWAKRLGFSEEFILKTRDECKGIKIKCVHDWGSWDDIENNWRCDKCGQYMREGL